MNLNVVCGAFKGDLWRELHPEMQILFGFEIFLHCFRHPKKPRPESTTVSVAGSQAVLRSNLAAHTPSTAPRTL